MRKLLIAASLLASCALTPVLAHAALTCDLTLTQTGHRIEAHLGLSGIADCPTTGTVTVEWTSPDKYFTDTTYEAPWHSCSKDVGAARTWCYRTVDLRDEDGKHHRAAGVWKVRVVSGTVVLAEGSITVQ